MPHQVLPRYSDFGGEFTELELAPPVGVVVHLVVGKPQQSANQVHWAWCTVEAGRPGYTDVVFTLADGQTISDPYPKPTPDDPDFPLRLGPVLFKVFC